MNNSGSQRSSRIRETPEVYAGCEGKPWNVTVGGARDVDARRILIVHHIRRRSALGDDAETKLITLGRERHQIFDGLRRDQELLHEVK
jgi:hypothetical protein